jgi:hypothetical protein
VPNSSLARSLALMALAVAAILALPAVALGGSGGIGPAGDDDSSTTDTSTTDTSTTDTTTTTVAGERAKLRRSGLAAAPDGAPVAVQRAIAAANRIDDTGYCTGGGHGNWSSRCYDCSGAVSYVLGPKGADILKRSKDSGGFERWGERGKGEWITVYTNAGHAMVVIAGLRFDTSVPDDGMDGPGWSKDVKAGMVNGPFVKRHFLGL